MKGNEITEKEYFEKRLDVAKNLLPTMVGQVSESFILDVRKRASLIYNCVAVSDDLLKEIGFKVVKQQSEPSSSTPPEVNSVDQTKTDVGSRTAIRKLSEMLKKE